MVPNEYCKNYSHKLIMHRTPFVDVHIYVTFIFFKCQFVLHFANHLPKISKVVLKWVSWMLIYKTPLSNVNGP